MTALDELHRHRDHHTRQLNAVNLASTVGVVGLALTVMLADGSKALPGNRTAVVSAWLPLVLFALGSTVLFYAAWLHWRFHANRIRIIDHWIAVALTPARAEDRKSSSDHPPRDVLGEWARTPPKDRSDPVTAGIADVEWHMYGAAAFGLALIAAATLLFLAIKVL